VTATIQVARRRVMQRVIAAPLSERRERQHTGYRPDDFIRAARGEQRAVRAIVHQNESSYEQPAGGNREKDGEGERPRERSICGRKGDGKQAQRRDELEERPANVRSNVGPDNPSPASSIAT
jgi:hypothetical protein